MRLRGRELRQLGVPARVAALLASCLVLAGCMSQTAAATTPSQGLGVNGWYLFYGLPPAQWDAQLAAMAADGVRVVRADAFWAEVEPSPPVDGVHSYDWTRTDMIVNSLARRGLQWLPVADYAAPWAESVAGDVKSAPGDTADYAAYAAALVSRYGPDGSFWTGHWWLAPRPITAVEIWNEENLSGTAIAASEYSRLYEAARAAIHGVDPSIEAIVGGLVNPAASYLDQMYSSLGGAGRIDAVADHPYGSTPTDTVGAVASLRSALNGHGDAAVPIDVTEFGWPTAGPASWIAPVTDLLRASYLSQVINTLGHSNCGVERILPYSWVTAQADPSNLGDWFGLAGPGGSQTLSSAALAKAYAGLAAGDAGAASDATVCGAHPSTATPAAAPPTARPSPPRRSRHRTRHRHRRHHGRRRHS